MSLTLNSQQIEGLNVDQLLDAVLNESQSVRACLTCSLDRKSVV